MEQHFLLVTFPAHGHINPTLHLAKRLARTAATHVTVSTTVSAHRRMFPSSYAAADQEFDDGILSYIPFSDGYDDGVTSGTRNVDQHMSRIKLVGSQSLSTIVRNLAARGRPVTRIIYSIILPWTADVARSLGIPSALFWIQPATAFAIYYRYFHGDDALIAAHSNDPSFTLNLTGLPPLQIRDLPSFLTSNHPDDPYSVILATFRDIFETLEIEETRPKVLVNTFEELEPDALAAIEETELIPVGPLVPGSLINGEDVVEGKGDYMEWLDSKPERSVVYVSFGTFATLKRRQVEEISRGLAESGRAYLWAMRKDGGGEGAELEEVDGDRGMMVEWVSQGPVLSHRAVGCFVTHCGWNSTLESLASGVPTVGVPQLSDQTTNARLLEATWGTGVRGEVDGEGVLEGRELRRCLEVVMGEGERGAEIRRRAEMWRARSREAGKEGGPLDRRLKAFLEEVVKDK